jgi:hypothetical protein
VEELGDRGMKYEHQKVKQKIKYDGVKYIQAEVSNVKAGEGEEYQPLHGDHDGHEKVALQTVTRSISDGAPLPQPTSCPSRKHRARRPVKAGRPRREPGCPGPPAAS